MALLKLDFTPGVNKENTPYSNEGTWVESDKIRFRAGKPEKIGGWEKYLPDQVVGIVRALHVFRTLDGTIYLAIATNEKVYVETGGLITDITPIRETQALSSALATTSGSTTVVVTDVSHGCDDGDWVTISGAAAVGGVPAGEINDEHKITYIDADSYSFTVTTAATSTVSSGGGASISAAYQINIGPSSGIYQYGWGAGGWSAGTWGTPRSSSNIVLEPRTWTFENWGEDLVFNHAEGSLYVWDATNPYNRGTRIDEAPHKVFTFTVTKDRHMVCFGCNQPGTANANTPIDEMQVRWSTQEDYTDWTPGVEDTAGDQLLTGGTRITGAANIEGQTIIWTDDDVHSMQYIGPPYTFGFQQVGTATGMISPKAWVAYNNSVYWMGENGFYKYQGGTAVQPCTVQRYVFEEFDEQQRMKTFTSLDRENHEITWFYPAESQEDTKLNGALTTTDTTIYVDSTAGFIDQGAIQIGAETIEYTGKADSKFTGCTRGARGTTAIAHDDESVVSNPDTTWTNEPYHYVTYNVLENIWWVGLMERTAWVDRGALKYPIAAGTDRYLYEHEKGYNSDGDPLVSRIESADFDLGEGDSLMFIKRVIPDFTVTGHVDLRMRTRYYPGSSQVKETIGIVNPTTEKIDTRIRGRQMSLVIESDGVDDNWRYGATRIDQRSDGRR